MDKKKPAVSLPRVAIYCRYSSEQQRNSLSIEAQERACLAFVKKQGWVVYRSFVDEARSGGNDRRAAFQRMISEAVAPTPPFDILLVHKSDRFARNREDAVKYKAILKRQKIRFVSATEPIGSGDVTDVLLESMLDGIAEFYSLQLSQRVLAGMVEAARHGWSIGRPVYGFRHVSIETPKGPKKKLVIDSARAAIVRKIFSLYVRGDGVMAIREKMAAKGHSFGLNWILRMLRNERYIGNTTYGKIPRKDAKTTMEPVTIKNTHEAIIDKKVWDKVQDLFDRRSSKSDARFEKNAYVLSGILRCTCGAAMVGQSAYGKMGKRFRYYGCGMMLRKGKRACPQILINADHLEEKIYRQIRDYLTNEDKIMGLIDAHNEFLSSLKKTKSKECARIRAEIQRLDVSAKNLVSAIEAGGQLNLGHVAERLDELSRQKEGLKNHALELEAFNAKPSISGKESAAFLKHIAGLFSSGLIRNKSLFHGLVKEIQILLNGTKAKVVYNPDFHPQADILAIEKAPPLGGSSHGKNLVSRVCSHANLLGEQLLSLDLTRWARMPGVEDAPDAVASRN